MGTFRIEVEARIPRAVKRQRFENVLVDTGAELVVATLDILEALGIERFSRWRFRQANGTVVRTVVDGVHHVVGSVSCDESFR